MRDFMVGCGSVRVRSFRLHQQLQVALALVPHDLPDARPLPRPGSGPTGRPARVSRRGWCELCGFLGERALLFQPIACGRQLISSRFGGP